MKPPRLFIDLGTFPGLTSHVLLKLLVVWMMLYLSRLGIRHDHDLCPMVNLLRGASVHCLVAAGGHVLLGVKMSGRSRLEDRVLGNVWIRIVHGLWRLVLWAGNQWWMSLDVSWCHVWVRPSRGLGGSRVGRASLLMRLGVPMLLYWTRSWVCYRLRLSSLLTGLIAHVVSCHGHVGRVWKLSSWEMSRHWLSLSRH